MRTRGGPLLRGGDDGGRAALETACRRLGCPSLAGAVCARVCCGLQWLWGAWGA